MKKICMLLLCFFLTAVVCEAQTSAWFEGFENDSVYLSRGWSIYNNSPEDTIEPEWNWTIRTEGSSLPGIGTSTCVVHSGIKSIGVSWWTGVYSGIADAWLVTPKLFVPEKPVFTFWITGGAPFYSDSVSIWIAHGSIPQSFLAESIEYENILFPIGSTYGVFQMYSIDLSAYAGQSIYIGFRYNMNTAVNGYYIQLDDITFSGLVEVEQSGYIIPGKFSLAQNYPNPFNPSTHIDFDLAKASYIKLDVYNSLGQKVMNLYEGFKDAGSYSAEFNAGTMSSGIYYYKLESDLFTDTKKMILIK